MAELGIATLTAVFCNANRDPNKGEPAKPADFFYFLPQEESVRLDAIASDTFFALVTDLRLPSWVVEIAPVEQLRTSRAFGPVPETRAWMCEGVLLLLPRIEEDKVKTPLAIVDGAAGLCPVIDIDGGSVHQIVVPNEREESYWVTDFEFELELEGTSS